MSQPQMLIARDLLRERPRTPADMRGVIAAKQRRVGRGVLVDGRTVQAYVNHGRWLFDCPHCNASPAIDPRWESAGCNGCGRTFAGLTVPENWRAIEDALAPRPVVNQHWRPGDTVADMLAENLERGV